MIPLAARRKVLNAASNVATSSHREAAILGSIVRCACASGRYDQRLIALWTVEALRGIPGDGSIPGRDEISDVLDQFQECYGRPLAS